MRLENLSDPLKAKSLVSQPPTATAAAWRMLILSWRQVAPWVHLFLASHASVDPSYANGTAQSPRESYT